MINELVATISLTTPPTILDALCTDGAATRSYWTSLIPYTRYLDKCRESTLLAFADYTDSANSNSATLGIASPLIFSGSTIRAGGTGSMSFEGYSITATGQYISYAP